MSAPKSRRAAAAAAATAATLIVISSCKPRENSDASMSSDTAAAPTATAGTDSAMPPTAPAQLSDANIVFLLDEANMADSAAGAFAVGKATSPDVKAFARLMMGEHHALRAQGRQLAQRLNVTPEPPANDPLKPAAEAEMKALKSATKGAAFDRTYIEQEIGIHKAVLDVAGKGYDAAQNAELKKLIQQAKPVIQKHLDRAIQIQQKLGKASA